MKFFPHIYTHSVRQLQQPPAQQCFPLISLQHQLPATSRSTVFFSHTTPAPAQRTELVRLKGKRIKKVSSYIVWPVVTMLSASIGTLGNAGQMILQDVDNVDSNANMRWY